MADIIDVEQTLVTLIAGILYPNGTGQPSSVTVPVRVYAGWPQSNALDADLIAGVANVSIYPTAIERNTTRYPRDDWKEIAGNKLIRETRRQERVFQIITWANTPTNRDTVSAAIDTVLSTTQFLTMPDGYSARLVYRSSTYQDGAQKAKLYRRDLMYSVEYATTETISANVVTEIDTAMTAQPSGLDVTIATTNIVTK